MHRDDVVELLRIEDSENGLVRYFLWNSKEYSVINTPCHVDDAKALLEAILRQAVNDYIKFCGVNLTKEEDIYNFSTAHDLLFDDDYHINYGGIDITVRDIIYFLTGQEPNMKLFREGLGDLRDRKKKR